MISKRSFNEVYDIINHLEPDLYNKIPIVFINFLKRNTSKDIKININYNIGINNQELEKDTKTILAIIYRDYICSEDEKERLIEADKKALIQQYEQDKIKIDNLFKKENSLNKQEEMKSLVNIEQIKWYEKIINYIKKMLRR